MKTATKNLETDHVHILRLIAVMERMIVLKSKEIAYIERVVYLIKNYADGIHHAKEENLFFPALIKNGFSPDQGPIAVMLHEHVQGRNHVQGMTEGILSFKDGNESALGKIYEHMQGYIDLLRNHISKENNVLFRMANKALSETDHLELLREFEKVENNSFGGIALKGCLTEIEGLETIFKED